MMIVLVEGESDAVALRTLAARLALPEPRVVPVGGSKGARRAATEFAEQGISGERLLGLVDAAERRDFERVLDSVFVCDPDLEAEFVRAMGIDAVLAVMAAQGELDSFRRLQAQPFLRRAPIEHQLARFFGGRSGNKVRYARLLAAAVGLEAIPAPLAALLARLARDGTHPGE